MFLCLLLCCGLCFFFLLSGFRWSCSSISTHSSCPCLFISFSSPQTRTAAAERKLWSSFQLQNQNKFKMVTSRQFDVRQDPFNACSAIYNNGCQMLLVRFGLYFSFKRQKASSCSGVQSTWMILSTGGPVHTQSPAHRSTSASITYLGPSDSHI